MHITLPTETQLQKKWKSRYGHRNYSFTKLLLWLLLLLLIIIIINISQGRSELLTYFAIPYLKQVLDSRLEMEKGHHWQWWYSVPQSFNRYTILWLPKDLFHLLSSVWSNNINLRVINNWSGAGAFNQSERSIIETRLYCKKSHIGWNLPPVKRANMRPRHLLHF